MKKTINTKAQRTKLDLLIDRLEKEPVSQLDIQSMLLNKMAELDSFKGDPRMAKLFIESIAILADQLPKQETKVTLSLADLLQTKED